MDTPAGLTFEPVTLELLGAGAEDGASVIAEANRKIQELSELVLDDRYTDEARITITIGIKADTNRTGVVIEGQVKEKRPAHRRKAVHGLMTRNGVVTPKADQLPLALGSNVVDMARAEGEGGQ